MKISKAILLLLMLVVRQTAFCQTAREILESEMPDEAVRKTTPAPMVDTVQNGKTITNTQTIGIGATDILDTYLSPEKYDGTEIRYVSHTIRDRRKSKWSRMIVHQGRFAKADNRSGEGGELSGDYTLDYGFHLNRYLCGGRLHIAGGLSASANIGFLYNTRNGNNPAQAHLSLNLAPYGFAAYRFSVLKRPAKIRYEVSIPVSGVMFSPHYGQSYYEIFNKGDYDNNVVFTTFVNAPSLRQMLALDLTLRRTTLRIGYMGDIRQAKVNNLKYHTYSNMFMIGLVRHFEIKKIVP